MKRTVVAFLLAPFPPAILVSLVYPLSGSIGSTDLVSLLLGVAFFHPFAFVASIAVAGPTFFLLSRLQLIRWWSSAFVGVVTGVVALAAFHKYQSVATYSLYGGLGALGGLTFWAVWLPRGHAAQPGAQADGPASGGSAA